MGAVYDAVSTAAAATGTSRTWAHVCGATGTTGLLLAWGWVNSTTDIVTAITYNSVSPAQTLKSDNGSSWVYLWRWAAPVTGSHDVVITTSASVSIAGAGLSLTGASQGNLNATVSFAPASSTFAIGSITPSVNDCFVGMFAANALEAPTVGANNTARTLTEKRAACTQWTNLVATPTEVYPWLDTTSATAWQAHSFAVGPYAAGGATTKTMHLARLRHT